MKIYIYIYIYTCVYMCLRMYSSYEYEHDWTYAMIVNFVVRTNLGLGINVYEFGYVYGSSYGK
jgi:hypothetical protein